jgi:hypothetical protein
LTNAIGTETKIKITISEACRRVDPCEQLIQSEGHEDKGSLADELSRDADAKEHLMCRDIVYCGRCVSVDNQLAGDVAHSEESHN